MKAATFPPHGAAPDGSRPLVSLNGVSLVYPVYSLRASSVRMTLMNVATGGLLLRDRSDVVQVRALSNVSMDLFEGDKLGLFGHNGSGKTTLLKVIAGLYEPTSGRLEINGRVSSMIELGSGLDPEATGVENIKMMGRLRGFSVREITARLPEISSFADLGGFTDLPLRTYSSGMAMRLLFAVSTSFDPEILVLDEWLGAGDAGFLAKAEERMEAFVAKSRLLVLASHNQALLQRHCNKLCVLDAGRVSYFGPPDGYFQ